jgi:acetyltransferase-like isoleucine patch superfamily enzyme
VLGAPWEAADVSFVKGVTSERTHRRKLGIIAGTGLDAPHFAQLIHPLAAASRRAAIGHCSCIGPSCAISGQVEIGAHPWLGSHAVIGHECVLGAGATVASSATLTSGVTIGAQTCVGSGAVLRPGISVGEGAPIGMGAEVLRHVPAGKVIIGNAARPLERLAVQASAPGQCVIVEFAPPCRRPTARVD